MGNRWAVVTQENTATFGNHTKYTTPSLDLDYINLDPDLDMAYRSEMTTGYDMKVHDWLEALNGRAKLENYIAGDNIGEFIKSVLGTYSVTASGAGQFRHKFEPDQAGTAWQVDIYDTDFTNYRTLKGLQSTSLEIQAAARGVASMSLDAIYATEATAAVGGATIPTIPSVRPFAFYDGSVTVEAAQARAESFRVRFMPQIPIDTHTLGNRSRQYLVKEGTLITAEVELSQADYNNLKRYYGGTGNTAPTNEPATYACEFTLDGPATGGAGEYDQYKMLINLPAMGVIGHRSVVDRRGRRMERLQLEALRNANNYVYLYNLETTYVAS